MKHLVFLAAILLIVVGCSSNTKEHDILNVNLGTCLANQQTLNKNLQQLLEAQQTINANLQIMQDNLEADIKTYCEGGTNGSPGIIQQIK